VCDDDVGFTIIVDQVEELCGAAPLLRVFVTDLDCQGTDTDTVRRALRNEAPFGPLRVRRLDAHLTNEVEAGVVAFAANMAAHAWLTRLTLHAAPLDTPAALDAVIDAVLTRRMHAVTFDDCGLPTVAYAPALARLLGSDALTTLEWTVADLLNAPAARVLAAALRANRTLTSLTLCQVGVFSDPAVAAELLGALNGHASLRVLDLNAKDVADGHRADVGACLGTLVAANASALTELNVSWCALGDDGLRPLFETLPHNTHLRTLKCIDNDMSEACARDVLPVVRANTSLRCLDATYDRDEGGSARQAMTLVAQRPSAE
jgi:hypothetical protein